MARSWLEELLANLQGEGGPQPYREGIPPGSVTSAPISDARPYVPFAMADPMADHGNVPQPPAVGAFGMPIAPPAWPSGPAGSTPVDEAAAAAAAREAAGARMIAANQRHTGPFAMPGMDSAGVQLAMDQAPAGTGVPVPGSPQFQPFGIPPSMAAAKGMAAPPQMQPQAPIAGLNAPIGGAPGAVPAGAPTDVSAARRPPVAPPGAPMGIPGPVAPPEAVEPSMMQRFGGGLSAAAPALLGLGAALSGDQGHLTVKLAADREAKAQQTEQANLTGRALLKAGAPPELAAAAMRNPELLKAAVGQYFGKDKFKIVKTGTDRYGNETYQQHNETDGTFKAIPGAAGAASAGPLIDPTLTGQDAAAAVKAVDPALHQQAMALVEGREMWPNARAMKDPRIKEATEIARQIDPDLTEQNAIARTTYMRDAANTKSGVGFQVKGFHQGIEHLAEMAKDIEKYKPSDGMGSADLAHAVNSIKQRFGESSGLARSIQGKAQAVAGEVGKLYSGQTGGGVHEREKTANLFTTGNSSATELAGSLQGTIDLMEGGLKSLESNRDRVMGEKGSQNSKLQYRNPETEARIEAIRSVIRRLKGEDTAPAPSAAVKPGNYVWKNGALVPQ